MFALIAGAGLVYGASWIGRKVPTVLSTVIPLLYIKERRKAEGKQKVIDEMDKQLQTLLSPHYDEDVELMLVELNDVPEPLRFLQGKRLVLTSEEMFFLEQVIEHVKAGGEAPFNLAKLGGVSEARLRDPEIAAQFA